MSEDWFAFDAWLVDLDGTLYRQTPVRLARAAELLLFGPHRIRAIRCFRREQQLLRRDVAEVTSFGASGCAYQTQLARAAMGLNCTVESLAPIIREWMEQRPGKCLRLFRNQRLLAEIASFRSRGGKTALVSDYPARTKPAGLQAVSLFDCVIASGEPGGPLRLKPSLDGYLLAAEQLQVPAARCLVIGDRIDADGAAAQRASGVSPGFSIGNGPPLFPFSWRKPKPRAHSQGT